MGDFQLVGCKICSCRLWRSGWIPSDNINKFLWMVHIGGGVFPRIKELDYLRDGQYRIDNQATPTMLNSLMYKLSYYRFVETDGKGYDRVRRIELERNISILHIFRRSSPYTIGWCGYTN